MPEAVASPCVDVCRMDGDYCVGCLRTMREIVRWGTAGDDEKRQVLAAVAQRRARLGAAHAGKAKPDEAA